MTHKVYSGNNWKWWAALIATIVLASAGHIITYRSEIAHEKRQARIERISNQLRNLYGPLYALSQIEKKTFNEFKKNNPWEKGKSLTSEQVEAWRFYITEIAMPYNLIIEKSILEHSDLLDEDEIPNVFLDLSAHIAGYKELIKAWDNKDYSKSTSTPSFPEKFDEYVKKKYIEIKKRQLKLLGESK